MYAVSCDGTQKLTAFNESTFLSTRLFPAHRFREGDMNLGVVLAGHVFKEPVLGLVIDSFEMDGDIVRASAAPHANDPAQRV